MIPAYFRSLAARFLHRSQTEHDLEEELRSHIQLRADDLERFGLGRAEAERRARIEFGGPERFKEECRDELAGNFIDVLLQDLRFGVRMLRKSPGFAAVVILTVALGIGATTAIFSVVDATLLRPLPYSQPEQLVGIQADLPGLGARDVGISQPEWKDLQESGIFEYVSPTWFDENNLTGSSQPARVRLLIVAPNYFALLGKTPGHAPADTVASAAILNQIETPDGVAQGTRRLTEARQKDPKAQLWPEVTVDIIASGHLREGDAKTAIEIFKLNLLAYPDSADAHYNLADAYLADGQKELARQYAKKALALLDSHAAPLSSWSDTEQRRGEIRRSAQKTLKKLSEPQG